jgi:hypothetical protein
MAWRLRTGLLPLIVGAGALLTSGAALAEGASLLDATEEQKAAAQEAFVDAAAKFEAASYADALEGYRKSHSIVASPNSRLMVARVLAKMGRNAEAYLEAEEAAREADAVSGAEPRYAEAADAARAEMDDLRAKIALLTVSVSGSRAERLIIGGTEIPKHRWSEPIPVEPGAVEIAAQSPAGVLRKDLVVAAGEATEVTLEVSPPPAPPPKVEPDAGDSGFDPLDGGSDQRLAGFVAGGVGVFGLAIFTGFGLAHRSTFDDLEDQCPDGRCPPELAGDADTGRTYQAVANVGFIVGLVGLAAGTALVVTSFGGEDEGETGTASLAVSPGFLSVERSF